MDFLSGHFKSNYHTMGHKPGGFTYFTSLREPIHRVVSQWNWYVPTISLNCSNDPSHLPRCSSALSSPSLPCPANPYTCSLQCN
jgi:hypothetical protein